MVSIILFQPELDFVYISIYNRKMWIYNIIELFNKSKVRYAVAGGYAVAFHGAVRGTVDLDFCIQLDQKNLKAIEEVLLEAGFASRIPVTAKEIFMFRQEYMTKKNLIAWSFYHPKFPAQIVDLLINEDLKDFDTITLKANGLPIKVLDIDSLIKIKKKAGRPQDLEDVKALNEIKKSGAKK